MAKNLEGSGRGLFKNVLPAVPGGCKEMYAEP
jgi:hypothetical protein